MSQVGRAVGHNKRLGGHTSRPSVATHLRRQGTDIRTVQDLPGHNDVHTTMAYAQVLNRGRLAVRRPLD